jgi:putative ABC transport system permease protein
MIHNFIYAGVNKNLGLHIFRSCLTVLGIIFGTGAFVTMLSILEGAHQKELENLETLGIDNIFVQSVRPPETGKREGEEIAWTPLVYGLDEKDHHRFEKLQEARQVVGLRDLRKNIYAHGRKTDLQVLATEPGFLETSRSGLVAGRFISVADMDQLNAVCVLGEETAEILFRNANPIGKQVRVGTSWYQVVGIIHTPSSLRLGSAGNPARVVLIPYPTANSRHGMSAVRISEGAIESVKVAYDVLMVRVGDLNTIEAAADRIRRTLEVTHKKTDYEVVVPYELLRQREKTQSIFAVVMGAIAGVSLLVGGIGVMNIMLANVYERTHEIGICLALGSRPKDILCLFLTEAWILALMGGMLGLVTGAGMASAITRWAGWATVFTPMTLLGTIIIAGGIGTAAGVYPAVRASHLSPIEAVRHE